MTGSASLQTSPRVLKISGIGRTFRFREKKDTLKPYAEPIDGLQLEGRMLSGNACVKAGLRDSAGKIYVSSAAKLTGKRSTVFLHFPPAPTAKYPLFLEWIELDNTESAPASAEIYEVKYVLQQNTLQAVDISAVTDTPIGVLRKGHEDKLKFKFINRSGVKGDYVIDVTMRHYLGRTLRERHSLMLAPGKEVCVTPKNKPDLWGHWDVIAEVRSKANLKESVKKETAFAYLDPAGPTPGRSPGFLFSICTHTERWSQGEKELEILATALCGAKVVRICHVWSSLQPEPGKWKWESLDYLVDNYGKQGVEVQYIMGYPPLWAVREEYRKLPWIKWNRSAPEDKIWRKYVEDMVTHYRGKIFYWEHWNEPDFGVYMSNAEYIRLQKSMFEVIRRVAPEATVMTGGFATLGDHVRKENGFYRDFFTGAKGAFDVHAHHEHGNFTHYQNIIDNIFIPMRAKYGIKGPWYANETAAPSWNGDVRGQGETLFKKLIFSWARGSIGYTWYDLRNDGFISSNPENEFGMLTNEFVPKPIYSVYNMLAGTFRTAKFVKQWNVGKDLWVFEFSDGAKRYLAAWDESPFAASHPLRIVTDAKSTAKIDLMGNKTAIPLHDGLCVFEVGSDPVILEVSNAGTLKCAGELIEFSSKGVAIPGTPYPVKTTIHNPWKKTVTFTLSISGERNSLKVAPGSKGELTFKPTPSAKSQLMLKWSNSLGMKGNIVIPVFKAKIIPAKDFNKRKPDFVLNKRKQFVSLVDANPDTAHRVWKNAKDLSVKAWAGVSGNDLKLRFDITDDVHKQPYSGTDVWKGDNIQFALSIPGQSGYWELGFSRLDSGKSEAVVFAAPFGTKNAEVVKAIRITTGRTGDLTRYQISIPLTALKTTPEKLKAGVRLNFIVNENDGEGRDGWLQLGPGIGNSKDPSKFPLLIFR